MSASVTYIRDGGSAIPLPEKIKSAVDELGRLCSVHPSYPHITPDKLERVRSYFFITQILTKLDEKPDRGYFVINVPRRSPFLHHFPKPIPDPQDVDTDLKLYCDRFPDISPARQLTLLTETDWERSVRLVYEALAPVFGWAI